MYAITGITGQVGGIVADQLQAAGAAARAVIRDAKKRGAFTDKRMEVAIADMSDGEALTRAFTGVEGVFILLPPNFAPSPGFPETRAILDALRTALETTYPPKVVVLSTVGAHREHGIGILEQLNLMERELSQLPMPVAFVRAAWFMENAQWDIPSARQSGQVASYLQPLDHPVPMVSTEDVGRVCAETLLGEWQGKKVVELEGPRRYSGGDIAAALGQVLEIPVQAIVVPRAEWTEAFEAQGMPHGRTEGRAEMIDGFNSGWIDFENEPIRGKVTLEGSLAKLVGR